MIETKKCMEKIEKRNTTFIKTDGMEMWKEI